MKNNSMPLVKLGILALPQILLLVVNASVKAELIADVKNDLKDPEITQPKSLTNQADPNSHQPLNP